LHPPWHHQPVRRPGGRHRQDHRRRLLPAPYPRRVPGLPQAGRQGPSPGPVVRDLRQLRHPQTPGCACLNMVEIFFGIITRQAIRRGTFTDVTDLQTAIRTYIDSYNERATPFAWTKTADELLTKIKRKSINNTRHYVRNATPRPPHRPKTTALPDLARTTPPLINGYTPPDK